MGVEEEKYIIHCWRIPKKKKKTTEEDGTKGWETGGVFGGTDNRVKIELRIRPELPLATFFH